MEIIKSQEKPFNMIDNYIYLFHTDQFIVLPTYPDSIQDSLSSSFNMTTPLSRSAPIYTYSNSGPRTTQISLNLHRDMMDEINYNVSNINFNEVRIGDDYVDVMIKQLQAIALPKYEASQKMVNPPLVAVRFGNEFFIKGIVNGGITVTYNLPLLDNDKYANVTVSFNVSEIDPYDAVSVQKEGSFRGLSKTLERRLFKR